MSKDVRAALIPENVVEFDRQWRAVMVAATESPDLSEVHRTLEAWRRVAWLTSARGHDGYRRLLADAERRTSELTAWSGPSIDEGNPEGNVRALPFGTAGLVTYLILEDPRRVDVLEVLWVD